MKKTSDHYDRIREFMVTLSHARELASKTYHELPDRVSMPSSEIRVLRAKLIFEEALETIRKGLGVSVHLKSRNGDAVVEAISDNAGFVANSKPNLVEIADGCADVSVVTIGTLIACGIPDVLLLALVDDNNLGKFGPGHYIRDDGKLIKAPDHKPPDVAGLLKELAWK